MMNEEKSKSDIAIVRNKVKLLVIAAIEIQYHKEANQYIHYVRDIGKLGTLVSTSHFNNVAGSDLDAQIEQYLDVASLERLLKLEVIFSKERNIVSKELIKNIDAIPEEEWWKSGTRETFISTAKTLMLKGCTEDEALDILESMYSAVSEEYGN